MDTHKLYIKISIKLVLCVWWSNKRRHFSKNVDNLKKILWINFNQFLGTKHFVHMKDNTFLKRDLNAKWRHPSPREDNSKNVKLYWKYLKFFFYRTTGLILSKLGTKHSWMKGIQVYSNEGPRPFPRGNNSEIINFYSN